MIRDALEDFDFFGWHSHKKNGTNSRVIQYMSCWFMFEKNSLNPFNFTKTKGSCRKSFFGTVDDESFVPSCRGGVLGDVFYCTNTLGSPKWQCITYLRDLYTGHGSLTTYYHGMMLQAVVFVWFLLYGFSCVVPLWCS